MNILRTPRASQALRLAALLLLSATAAAGANPPQREHLTPQEIEMVRDNQELEKRIAVFIKAAERRFLAVTDPQQAAARAAKEAGEWGEVKGTRTQLLSDLARILEEAVTNIDDTAGRSPSSPALKKSLNKLAEASRRFIPPLAALREAAQDETERDALERVLEGAQEIVEAAHRHPDEEKEDSPKDAKKKKSGL